MMKQTVTTIALTLLTSTAFSQAVLKDELKSLKDKKAIVYQQAEQARLDQVANINKKYYEVLKQLLLKAKISSDKDSPIIRDIKRELASIGHFEPEDWYFGTWTINSQSSGDLQTIFKIDFDGSVSQINPQTKQAFSNFINGKIEVQSDSKVHFKQESGNYEVQKVSTGRSKFTYVTDRYRIEKTGTRE